MNKPSKKKESPKIHVCSKCGSAFNRPYRLRQHEKTHDNVKQFVCGELNCNKSYTNKSHLDRHIFSVHKEPEVNVIYSCPQCMKVYVNRQNLKRHINTYHGRKTIFTCDVCNRDFKKKHLLSGHMYEHTFVKSFSCDYCTSEFITLLEKKKHMKQHKTYSCDMCEMAFVRWSQYLKHKKMHKEYHCDDCGRKFYERTHIVRHMKVHNTRYTPTFYPCTYDKCDRVYTRSNNLKQHIKMKHLKIKHDCEICFAKLSSKAKLLIHLEAHKKPKDCFLQPTKEMGRMLRVDKGAAKVSTALRIAGLIIDPENESIRGTLKNIADCTTVKHVSADAISDQDMLNECATEEIVLDNSVIEKNTIDKSESVLNGTADIKSELNCIADSTFERNGIADSTFKQNGIADSTFEQNGIADKKTEPTSESHIAMEVEKLHSVETDILNETLKPGFIDHSIQQICQWNIS